MTVAPHHLLVLPVLLPMGLAAGLLFLGERRRRTRTWLSIAGAALGLVVALAIASEVERAGTLAYLAGNWRAPFGIALVADRLTVIMLVTTAVLGLATSLYASARWDQAGVHFHPLLQLELMGLNGAFLTGDLFNLFVFFEIMLAASYGLLLHGAGRTRVLSGLHYLVINLAASSLFLVGAAMLYGVTGTLNLADMAQRMATLNVEARGLANAAVAVLAVAFLVKAAVWPLNFWLVPAYASATAPVGALFALLTKVGVYAIARVWTLLFVAQTARGQAPWGASALLTIGLASVVFGAIGLFSSQRLARISGFAVLVSSGTLLAALGVADPRVTAGALYYLPASALAVAALVLLTDIVERWRNGGAALAPHQAAERAPYLTHDLKPLVGINLDEDERELSGKAIPAASAFVGLVFLAVTLVIAGLPPSPGFIGKFAMLSAAFESGIASLTREVRGAAWWLLAALLLSGLLALVTFARAGIRHFWTQPDRPPPHVRWAEGLPLGLILACLVALSLWGDAAMRFANDAAQSLHAPRRYIAAVLNTEPVPAPPSPNGPKYGPGSVGFSPLQPPVQAPAPQPRPPQAQPGAPR